MIMLRFKTCLQNILPSKIVNVKLKVAGFSIYHFYLSKKYGKPMPSVENQQHNDTAYLIFKFREMKPKEEKGIKWRLLLRRKSNKLMNISLDEIPNKESMKIRKIFHMWFSKRLNNAALRLLKKSRDLINFEIEVMKFLARNFRKIEKLSESPTDFFETKYGGIEDFAFGFRVLNAIVGVPTRGVYGFKKEDSRYIEWIWVQAGYEDKWIDFDPFLGELIEQPNNHVPIMIFRNVQRPPLYTVNYKTVRRILKRGLDFRILQFKIEVIKE